MSTLIDSLQPADLQQVIPLLKSNFINPTALNEVELNRATLQGLIARLGHGAVATEQCGGTGGCYQSFLQRSARWPHRLFAA